VGTLQADIPAARDACHSYRQKKDGQSLSDTVEQVDKLYGELKEVSTAREKWWASKRELREQLQEEVENERKTQNFKAATQGEKAKQLGKGAHEKYNELQAINTRAVDMLTDM